MTVKIERNLSLTEVKNRFLRRVMATKKMQWLQVCTKNQIATQQSGCLSERKKETANMELSPPRRKRNAAGFF